MTKLPDHYSPTAASIPITLQGNHFRRAGARFLLKAIAYTPHAPRLEHQIESQRALVDPLSDAHLPELKKDIPYLKELGVNCISVEALDPTQSHTAAMNLLEQHGLYVLVQLFSDLHPPRNPTVHHSEEPSAPPPAPHYPRASLLVTFTLVAPLTTHPNLLACTVDASSLTAPGDTPFATVYRACIRDTKHFLHLHLHHGHAPSRRQIPIGITTAHTPSLHASLLRYFTAGAPAARADFFGGENWSWVGPSDFQMSGWKAMVEMYEAQGIPRVPMILAGFGTKCGGSGRVWDEVSCLFGAEMTGWFSGGVVYRFLEDGGDGYGVLKVGDGGVRRKRREFRGLKERLAGLVDREVAGGTGRAGYEEWRGEFPEVGEGRWGVGWFAGEELPEFPGGWEGVLEEVRG
ncbi:hypothetical protein B0A50_03484 [Salinomyces thailandicus]|uniref:1,3-beta-glucanosyltransferase n=1 Tax=Salinomyces thailandicus TaxID=706561 RepID=A0A4U0U370_9PEZI|nr:hypothetical protein B0A50_03484 [Salinomyces thailandica]